MVDRMEQNGKVTEQDRQDLNRAMNILGKPDREAHPERGATKDVLRRHVGKDFTPEVKHKAAQALYHQFGIDERPYSLNLYSQPRRILQSTLDPAGFNKALDDGKLSRGQYGAHSNKPRFEDAPANQRAQIADAEMAAMKAAANLSLTADTMVNEIIGEISNVIDQAADGFETPSQEQQRINQERSQRIAVPSLDPKRNLEQLKALRDRYVPGGDQFEAIKQKLGLKDHEFDKNELVRGINAQLMNSFGSFGDRLGSDQSANKSDAETALLRAISGHIRTQRMTSQLLVSNDRANVLQGLADDWEINGIPD